MGFAADSQQRERDDQDVGHCSVCIDIVVRPREFRPTLYMQIVCDEVVICAGQRSLARSLGAKFLDVFLLGGNELCLSLGEELVERYIQEALSIKEGMLYPLVPLLSDGSLGSGTTANKTALLSFVFCIWATNATWNHLPPTLVSC